MWGTLADWLGGGCLVAGALLSLAAGIGVLRFPGTLDRMHAATGDAKVQAIEALLDEMLAQHRAMHEMMMGMHHPMGMDGMKHEEKADHPDD